MNVVYFYYVASCIAKYIILYGEYHVRHTYVSMYARYNN